MLFLSRKNRESVVVGRSNGVQRLLKITVLEIHDGTVSRSFEVGDDFPVPRWEVWERIRAGDRPEVASLAGRTPMGKSNVERRNHAWFALADAERCRLLCCRLTEQGTQHVDEYDALENTFPEPEHLRPQTGDGMTHDVEERERRFAGKIVERLRENAQKHQIDRLVIFAPPRMLGVLRRASSELLAGHLKELESNLMRLDAGQLAEHPMVRALVPATQGP
jgi:protein required for attachment to host cells